MIYDFDNVPDRHGTDCMKFDFAKEMGIPEDNLSLWVADMDFPVAECIKSELNKIVNKGVFGYTGAKEDYYQAVINWYSDNFAWNIEKDWLLMTPGVVFALANAVRAFTKPGDKIMIQRPVYYPFSRVISGNDRHIVNNLLKYTSSGSYEMDFADMAEKLKDPDLKMFILCSPHNPVGRVWSKEELIRLEELCLENDVIVVSDEIHSDFIWGTNKHHILASIDKRFEKNTVICTAPSKTFNLAGLQLSNIVIPDEDLRKQYKKALDQTGFFNPNQFGLAACRAAYTEGREWLDQVREYIHENILFTKDFLEKNIPGLKLIETEGTYLMWIDCRGLGLSDKELNDMIINKAHLWLDAGNIFGKEGEGFQRINAACPRSYLQQALIQLQHACRP